MVSLTFWVWDVKHWVFTVLATGWATRSHKVFLKWTDQIIISNEFKFNILLFCRNTRLTLIMLREWYCTNLTQRNKEGIKALLWTICSSCCVHLDEKIQQHSELFQRNLKSTISAYETFWYLKYGFEGPFAMPYKELI